MKRSARRRAVVVSAVCAAALAAVAAAPIAAATGVTAPAGTPAQVQPGSNKGRTGTYEAKTSHQGYNYYVYVPKSYSESNPAGLHVYFHGQGGGGSAPHFGQWAKYFLEPFNLIGINMQYTDGDNSKDTAGKVDAAVEAIRQVLADYKVVFGRGAVGSFSGGGLPHEHLFAKFGKYAAGGPSPCPFNHSALYGSNYWGDPTAAPPMSWFIGIGTKEWDMGMPTLGTSQTRKADQLFSAAMKGGMADVYFKVTKDKGHTISDDDVRDSAAQFRRSDLALAPFVYEKDFTDAALAPIARLANGLALGRASAAIDKLAADPKIDPSLKAKAGTLKKIIDDRIEAVLGLTRELAESDYVLCMYYGNLFAQQLGTHPRAKELKDVLAAARKKPGAAASAAAFGEFCTNFKNLFQGRALRPGAAKFLESVKARSAETSLLGKMAAEILLIESPVPPGTTPPGN